MRKRKSIFEGLRCTVANLETLECPSHDEDSGPLLQSLIIES